MKTTKKLLTIALMAAMLTACSPQKRLSRLLDHHPELREPTPVTVVWTDTIILPHTDTTVTFLIDTVTVPVVVQSTNARATLAPIRTAEGRQFQLTAELMPDTIVVHDTIRFTVETVKEFRAQPSKRYRFFHDIGVLLGVGLCIAIMILGLLEAIRQYIQND